MRVARGRNNWGNVRAWWASTTALALEDLKRRMPMARSVRIGVTQEWGDPGQRVAAISVMLVPENATPERCRMAAVGLRESEVGAGAAVLLERLEARLVLAVSSLMPAPRRPRRAAKRGRGSRAGGRRE